MRGGNCGTGIGGQKNENSRVCNHRSGRTSCKTGRAFCKKAAEYQSGITVKNMENGKSVDAKRIMAVMSLGVKQGNKIELSIEGTDEDTAATELEAFLKENL